MAWQYEYERGLHFVPFAQRGQAFLSVIAFCRETHLANPLKSLAHPSGLEPLTYRLEGRRYIFPAGLRLHLAYQKIK